MKIFGIDRNNHILNVIIIKQTYMKITFLHTQSDLNTQNDSLCNEVILFTPTQMCLSPNNQNKVCKRDNYLLKDESIELIIRKLTN